jgi:hypothetical protein
MSTTSFSVPAVTAVSSISVKFKIRTVTLNKSASVNSELRLTLGKASAFMFRAEYGLFIFGDVGRVFSDDEDSDKWHPSGGGGISAATLDRSLLWSLTVAQSNEKTALFFTANYSF